MKQILYISTCLFLMGCLSGHQINLEAANDNVELGLNYLAQKDPVLAKEKLLLAMDQAPDSPTVLDALAYYFEITEDTKRADYFFRRALAINPHSGLALNNYGVFLCRMGYQRLALKYLVSAADQIEYLHTANALENAGFCAQMLGDKAAAQKYFLEAAHQKLKLPHV